MTDEELAALSIALELVCGPSTRADRPKAERQGFGVAESGRDDTSRWKLAMRRPELELEDLRAL